MDKVLLLSCMMSWDILPATALQPSEQKGCIDDTDCTRYILKAHGSQEAHGFCAQYFWDRYTRFENNVRDHDDDFERNFLSFTGSLLALSAGCAQGNSTPVEPHCCSGVCTCDIGCDGAISSRILNYPKYPRDKCPLFPAYVHGAESGIPWELFLGLLMPLLGCCAFAGQHGCLPSGDCCCCCSPCFMILMVLLLLGLSSFNV